MKMILVGGVPVHVKILEDVNMTALNVSIERCANCGHYLDEGDFILAYHYDDLYGDGFFRYLGYACTCGYMEEI